jgi:glutaredoxin
MWDWLRHRPSAVREVVMYTRQGCCLCEQAWQVLEKAQRRFGFTLQKVDVDSDPALAEQFGLQVPVVRIDGKVHFRGQVNAVLLNRLLRARSPEDRLGDADLSQS